MEVYLTRHARNRMRLYEVAEGDVRGALEHPERITPASFQAVHAWKRTATGAWLRVTYTDEGARRVVITVTPRSHPPGGTDAH